jgi:hypothetical protein
MNRFLVLLALGVSLLGADTLKPSTPLSQLNNYKYETPQGRQMKIPKSTQLLVIAFEKDTGALVNDYLATMDPFYMPKHRAVFIADINKMPSIITKMFALPKMQKYKHLVYLHYEEQFQNFVPHREEKITLARIKEGKVESISYISTKEELKAAIEQ